MHSIIRYLPSQLNWCLVAMLVVVAGSVSARPSARDFKQLARDNLSSLASPETPAQADALAKAVTHVDESLDAGLWQDADHLQKKGEKVFEEEKHAAHAIREYLREESNRRRISAARSSSIPALIEALGLLVRADSVLAMTAYNDLVSMCGNHRCQDEVEKARHCLDELQKLSEKDDEKEQKQIEIYKKMWHHACDGIESVLTDISGPQEDSPRNWRVQQNYPNPFNPKTDFGFRIADVGLVTVKIYNVLGIEVATLMNEVKQPGEYKLSWDASNFTSGVYFYQVKAGSLIETRKMILIR